MHGDKPPPNTIKLRIMAKLIETAPVAGMRQCHLQTLGVGHLRLMTDQTEQNNEVHHNLHSFVSR